MGLNHTKLSVLILEDETLARKRLITLLEECGIKEMYEAGNATDAFAQLEKYHIDVIFVDIGLPGISGMGFVSLLQQRSNSPQVIFTTAYDNYAVEAFETNAVDYLLKPIRLERLKRSLGKLVPSKPLSVRFISVHHKGKVLRVPFDEMRYFRAEDKYIVMVKSDKTEYLMDGTLVKQEGQWKEDVFRIHRRYLVNTCYISGLVRSKDALESAVSLKDVSELLPISRRQLPLLRQLLNKEF